MSLLALLADVTGGGETPPPVDDGPIPYPMPTAAPYHVPYAITPTGDGSGSVVHPGVIDMGTNGWRGWRYWMAVTGYWLTNDQMENPHILASNDGYHWHVPAGLTNPIYPAPPAPRFNSDTDIAYDATNDRLVMIYRELLADGSQQTLIATSSDGTTWPATATPLDWDRVGGTGQHLSPSIVCRGPGDWWLFSIGRTDMHLYYHRATDPTGRWTGPVSLGRPNLGHPQLYAWHLDVDWDGTAFRAVADLGPRYLGRPDGYRAGTIDADGTTQIWASENFMELRDHGWDTTELYRATITPHEDGTHFRMWYSADGNESWRLGYTQVPRSLWPNIGDTITYPTPAAEPPQPLTPTPPWNPTNLQQAIVDLGAEGYWKLDETSGVKILDHSGRGRHGILQGVPGHAYQHAGIDGHIKWLGRRGTVRVDDSDAFTPGPDGMTVFAAVNSRVAGGYLRIVAKHVEEYGEWGMYAQATSLAGGYTAQAGGGWYAYSGTAQGLLPVGNTAGGAWHGVAMAVGAKAIGGDKPQLFIGDGTGRVADPGLITVGTAPGNTSCPLYIGGGAEVGAGTHAVEGIRHVAVFMRQLTPAEIGTLMTLARTEGIIT